jgi:glycosyltransferase involved in cell wall biosynthesis
MKTVSDALNRHQDQGWRAKLMHFTGFMTSVPGPNYDATMQEWIAPADLIIFQRNIIVPQAIAAIKYWRGLGKVIAIDLDDAYQLLPWSNPAHKFWHEQGVEKEDFWNGVENGEEVTKNEQLKTLEEGLRLSAGLISPNRNLLQSWGYCVGKKQYYLQNYAEPDWWTDLPSRDEMKEKLGLTGKTVIGWGGSISHYDSFWGSGIFEAAKAICKAHDEVVWLICGNDKRIYDHLDVPLRQKQHQPGVPPEEWPKIVKTFDIGVAPLFGWYDQHRSWIKGIEYLLAGVPWIGTEGGVNGTYTDLGGLGYLIPNGVESWERRLNKVIVNLENEQHRYEQLIPVARERFIVDNNLSVYAKVYRKIIDDFSRRGDGNLVDILPEVAHVG